MHRKNSLIIACLIFILPISSQALESDATQEITIQSNSADLDRKSGIANYIGNVVFEQGTLKITANKITLFSNDDKKLTKAIAVGENAHFEQLMEGDKGLTKAQARTITYLITTKNITLLQDAILTQEGNEFTGETIIYNVIEESVSAKGGTTSELTPQGQQQPTRIKMIIQPQDTQDNTQDDDKVIPSEDA